MWTDVDTRRCIIHHYGSTLEGFRSERRRKKKKSKAIKTVSILGSVLGVCLVSQMRHKFVSGYGDSLLNQPSRLHSHVTKVLSNYRKIWSFYCNIHALRNFRSHGNALWNSSSSDTTWRPILSGASVEMPVTTTSQNMPFYI